MTVIEFEFILIWRSYATTENFLHNFAEQLFSFAVSERSLLVSAGDHHRLYAAFELGKPVLDQLRPVFPIVLVLPLWIGASRVDQELSTRYPCRDDGHGQE